VNVKLSMTDEDTGSSTAGGNVPYIPGAALTINADGSKTPDSVAGGVPTNNLALASDSNGNVAGPLGSSRLP
jgi:hypothetical protein